MRFRASRALIAGTIVLGLIGVVIVLVARNTYWESRSVQLPLRGEALRNPFYGAQRFVDSLGMHSERQHLLHQMPSPRDVIVLGAFHWDLIASRRARLEHWVAAGGRLVVDRSLIGSIGAFSRWSGIDRLDPDDDDDDEDESDGKQKADKGAKQKLPAQQPSPLSIGVDGDADSCRALEPEKLRLCGFRDGSKLAPLRLAQWSLHDNDGPQIVRMAVGRGSVTVVNGWPFTYRSFLDGDHARVLLRAGQLVRGDRVHFLTEQNHPSLLALLWIYGAPAVCLALVLIALALWRNSVRLGPALPAFEPPRRSLGEQILGTGRFVQRFGGGFALLRAQMRALDDAARGRISGYATLSIAERAQQIGQLTAVEPGQLARLMSFSGSTVRTPQLRSVIQSLESVRRRILQIKKGR